MPQILLVFPVKIIPCRFHSEDSSRILDPLRPPGLGPFSDRIAAALG